VVVRLNLPVQYVTSRMLLLVCVFLAIWLFPMSDRLFSLITSEASPQWLTDAHFIALSLEGVANAAVWYVSRPLQSIRNPLAVPFLNPGDDDDLFQVFLMTYQP
jgi:hypothetical protein